MKTAHALLFGVTYAGRLEDWLIPKVRALPWATTKLNAGPHGRHDVALTPTPSRVHQLSRHRVCDIQLGNACSWPIRVCRSVQSKILIEHAVPYARALNDLQNGSSLRTLQI
jgi:methyl coenzyme M reductase subunit C